MDEETLRQGLARLLEAELVFVRGTPPSATYTFKHALVQEAAYESLLKSTRAQCHRRVGFVLAERFPNIAEAEPELLAQHFHTAGLAAEAVEYWRRAGLKAIQRSPNEASRHLERAVEALGTLTKSAERDQLELALLTALGPTLIATRGFTAPEVGRNYERALELCRRAGDAPQLFAALWGLWLFNANRGHLRMAREIGERSMGLAQRQGDRGLLMQAHHMLGATYLSLGPLTSSRSHFEAAIALYDPIEHRSHASLYGGHDPGVCSRGFGAHAIWMLGYPDLAFERTRDAIALAQALEQPTSLAHALISAAILHQLRRDPQSAFDVSVTPSVPTAVVTAWPIRMLMPGPRTSRLRTRRATRGSGMCHFACETVVGWVASVVVIGPPLARQSGNSSWNETLGDQDAPPGGRIAL